MYEKELLENQKRIGEIMKGFVKQPQEALSKLEALQKETEKFSGEGSPEYYSVAAAICEAMGDLYMRIQQPQKAEKSYQEMTLKSVKLYECDKEKYDYRLGGANYKLGMFYRGLCGCQRLLPKPRELNDSQKKIWGIAEKCYKNALACTMQNAKKGVGRYVELHSTCLEALMGLHGAVGNYETAVLLGKDCVRLGKAVYEKLDDRMRGVHLANQMTGLGAIYTFMKNPQLAMECLEDAIYVLEAHEKEDAKGIGAMLARNYISLGSCYSMIEEEKEQAEEFYKKGLDRMNELNDQSGNRMIDDVIQSYVFVGDYYKRVNKEFEAKTHYTWAVKLASDMWRVTKQPKYESLMKQLQAKVS